MGTNPDRRTNQRMDQESRMKMWWLTPYTWKFSRLFGVPMNFSVSTASEQYSKNKSFQEKETPVQSFCPHILAIIVFVMRPQHLHIGFEASLGIVIHQPKLGEGSIKAYTTWPLQKRYFTLKAKHAFQYMMGGVTFSNINELFYHPLCDLGTSRVWGNCPSTHLAANFFMSA